MTHPEGGNRAARRAEAAQRRRNRKRTANLPIGPTGIEEIGDAAFQAARALVLRDLGVGTDFAGTVMIPVNDPHAGARLASAETAAAALIPFIAASLLEERDIACRVVVGSAIWSVGPGDTDKLDHGVQNSFGPAFDAASGNYHTWLEIGGHTVDFAARLLPLKFEDAAALAPFSTPCAQWRRFPRTTVHPAGVTMPDPVHDRRAAYGYREGSPALDRAVRQRVLPILECSPQPD